MKLRLLALLVGITLAVTACDTAQPPAPNQELEMSPGDTLYFDPATGESFVSTSGELDTQGFSVTLCAFTWNNVHQTSFGGAKEIKSDWTGSCPSSSDPFYLTPRPSMQKQNTFGTYSTVTPKKVTAIRKNVSKAGAKWIRTEVFVTTTCVNGSYKGKIDFTTADANGVALATKLAPGITAAFKISSC